MGTTPSTETQRRRSDRRSHKAEITLLGKLKGLEYEEPAHTVDLSDHGLGVLTDNPVDPARSLEPGQIVYVIGAEESHLGYYRVVWARADTREAPTWAGLRYLN